MTFEYLPVLIRTHPIGNAAKPERPVERIRIPVDIVGILVPDPPRMGLQIYFGNDDGTRFAHGTELLDGANHIIEMLERRLTEDDVDTIVAEGGHEVKAAAYHHAQLRLRPAPGALDLRLEEFTADRRLHGNAIDKGGIEA